MPLPVEKSPGTVSTLLQKFQSNIEKEELKQQQSHGRVGRPVGKLGVSPQWSTASTSPTMERSASMQTSYSRASLEPALAGLGVRVESLPSTPNVKPLPEPEAAPTPATVSALCIKEPASATSRTLFIPPTPVEASSLPPVAPPAASSPAVGAKLAPAAPSPAPPPRASPVSVKLDLPTTPSSKMSAIASQAKQRVPAGSSSVSEGSAQRRVAANNKTTPKSSPVAAATKKLAPVKSTTPSRATPSRSALVVSPTNLTSPTTTHPRSSLATPTHASASKTRVAVTPRSESSDSYRSPTPSSTKSRSHSVSSRPSAAFSPSNSTTTTPTKRPFTPTTPLKSSSSLTQPTASALARQKAREEEKMIKEKELKKLVSIPLKKATTTRSNQNARSQTKTGETAGVVVVAEEVKAKSSAGQAARSQKKEEEINFQELAAKKEEVDEKEVDVDDAEGLKEENHPDLTSRHNNEDVGMNTAQQSNAEAEGTFDAHEEREVGFAGLEELPKKEAMASECHDNNASTALGKAEEKDEIAEIPDEL